MALATSYNGWTASPNWADIGGLENPVISGRRFVPGFRAGDVAAFFWMYFGDYDLLVEDLDLGSPAADEWGAAFRLNRNANNYSCHASATAGDANATLHPNGVRGTLNGPSKGVPGQSKIQVIRRLSKVQYRGLVRCGEDYAGTPDGMHHELICTPGQLAQFMRGIRELAGGPPVPGPPLGNLPAPNPAPQPWIMLPPVRSRPESFQRWYNAEPFRPALLPVIKPIANNFGPQSGAALKRIQARYGLTPDGIDGPLTKKVLWDLGWRGDQRFDS